MPLKGRNICDFQLCCKDSALFKSRISSKMCQFHQIQCFLRGGEQGAVRGKRQLHWCLQPFFCYYGKDSSQTWSAV